MSDQNNPPRFRYRSVRIKDNKGGKGWATIIVRDPKDLQKELKAAEPDVAADEKSEDKQPQ